jgi:hypothetical protein
MWSQSIRRFKNWGNKRKQLTKVSKWEIVKGVDLRSQSVVISRRSLAVRAKDIDARVENIKERVRRYHILGTKEVERACVKIIRFHLEPDESFDLKI